MKSIKYSILFIIFLLNPILSLKSQDFWEQLYFPDTADILNIAVNDQGYIFCGTATGIYRSMDTGVTWETIGMTDTIINSMAINENGDVYAGNDQTEYHSGLFRSSNNGQSWESLVPDIGVYGNISCILPMGDTIFANIGMRSNLIRSTNNGLSWSLVFSSDNTSEYISDIAQSGTGDIYISLMCFFPNIGGVYKSVNLGDTWEYVGLINHQVYSLEFNSNDDLFIGVWSDFVYATGGFYVLYNGSDEIEELLFGPTVADLVINSDNDIYFADVPSGIIRSQDNGQTFEYVNEGLSGTTGRMSIDSQGFIYLASIYSSNRLAKSIDPTITGIETEPLISPSNNIRVIPNPASDRLTIIFKENFNHKNKDIIIFNSLVIEVQHFKVSQNVKEIVVDTSNLRSGLYFVVMKAEGIDVVTGKFLVVK